MRIKRCHYAHITSVDTPKQGKPESVNINSGGLNLSLSDGSGFAQDTFHKESSR